MTRRPCRNHSPAFKAKVALAWRLSITLETEPCVRSRGSTWPA